VAFVDYDFYANVFQGNTISPDDLSRLAARAFDYVNGKTRGLAEKAQGRDREAVQRAVCAVAEVLQDEARMSAKAFSEGAEVSSETVGSWSRSYRSSSLSGNEAAYLDGRKREALDLYLGALPAFSGLFKVRSYRCGRA
jgi:hypothetical protein